jgi:hypothetical protein
MHRARPAAVGAILSALFTVLSAPARADEPEPPLPYDLGGKPKASTPLKTAAGGLAMTAGWYGAAVGFSYAFQDAPGSSDLRIPVAGPFMALGETGCQKGAGACSTFGAVLRAIFTIVDGVGQAGGLLIATEAVFMETQPEQPASGVSLSVHGTDTGWALGLEGRF